jgi:hypothetical protein
MTERQSQEQAAALARQAKMEQLTHALRSMDYQRTLACQKELDRLGGELFETISRPPVTRQPVASVPDRRRWSQARDAETAGLSVVKLRHEAMRWRRLAADATTPQLRKHLLALARKCERQTLAIASRSAR